jgi:hypothetical protein
MARILVGRHLVFHVGSQLLGADGGIRLEDHRGADLLAQGRVRHADHGGLRDRGMLVQHFLEQRAPVTDTDRHGRVRALQRASEDVAAARRRVICSSSLRERPG